MAFATWWRGDQLPTLAPLYAVLFENERFQSQNSRSQTTTRLATFFANPTGDAALLARLANLELVEVQSRLSRGHRPYVAWLENQPVAYGWVATHTAHIGELDLTITLPRGERYLWDFATLPAWRGRGIYPHLLQTILRAESSEAARFWIIAAPENRASSAGIAKAGFIGVAHLSFQRAGQPGLVAMTNGDRVSAAAELLRLPLLPAEPQLALSPCWHCAIDAREGGHDLTELVCWPMPSAHLTLTACSCS